MSVHDLLYQAADDHARRHLFIGLTAPVPDSPGAIAERAGSEREALRLLFSNLDNAQRAAFATLDAAGMFEPLRAAGIFDGLGLEGYGP